MNRNGLGGLGGHSLDQPEGHECGEDQGNGRTAVGGGGHEWNSPCGQDFEDVDGFGAVCWAGASVSVAASEPVR